MNPLAGTTTLVAVLSGSYAVNDVTSGRFDWQGFAAFITALSGLVATVWVVVKGSRKSAMSAEDLEKLLDAFDHRHDGDDDDDEGAA